LTATVIEGDIERFKEAVRFYFIRIGGAKPRSEIWCCIGTGWDGRVRVVDRDAGEPWVAEAKEALTKGTDNITSRIDD